MHCSGHKTSAEFQSQHCGASPAILAKPPTALKDAKKAELVEF